MGKRSREFAQELDVLLVPRRWMLRPNCTKRCGCRNLLPSSIVGGKHQSTSFIVPMHPISHVSQGAKLEILMRLLVQSSAIGKIYCVKVQRLVTEHDT